MNKPNQCGNEFDALKTAFNAIVEDYSNLPTKLKAQGVKRVSFKFSHTDLGNTDLKDSKSLCEFAGRLVSQLKKAEDHHKKRLSAARALVCTKAGKVLKLISNMGNCLRKARTDARTGSDAEAETAANEDARKFDANALQRVRDLLNLTKRKCLMKDTPASKPARVSGVFRETLATKIKRKSGALTDEDKKQIAQKFDDAVAKKYPQAINIITSFTDSSRRQLRPRRALADGVNVLTTWDLDFPALAADNVEV